MYFLIILVSRITYRADKTKYLYYLPVERQGCIYTWSAVLHRNLKSGNLTPKLLSRRLPLRKNPLLAYTSS